MIQVAEVSKTYRAFEIDRKESGIGLWLKNAFRLTSNTAAPTQALDNVSFQVGNGEVFGIFGANGAGKTTLIKIMTGLLRPDQGCVDVGAVCDPNRIKSLVSYVSTNGWMGLEWQLTAHENLLLYGNLFGITGARLRSRCDSALSLLDLDEARQKHISELSAGMRQKVTLARGLILDRPVLYLDEPTVSLDVQSAAQVRSVVADVAAVQGKTVLITSHNPEDLAICDRILFLHRGRVVALDSWDRLLTPMRSFATLHVTFVGDGAADERAESFAGLCQLSAVRSVQVERAQGRHNHWLARLVVAEVGGSVDAIIDWFILRDLPIVGLHTRPVTLQELYEHYVAVSDAISH